MDSIIFDVDGTIWNSTDVVAQAWNEVLEKEKIDIRVTADQAFRKTASGYCESDSSRSDRG